MVSGDEFFARWFPGEAHQDAVFHNHVATRLPSAGKILDLGCGDNRLLERYRSADLEVWGADFGAHPTLQNPEWFRALRPDGKIPFADQTFDLVTSFMVMEHVVSPSQFFDEISRVLKPGGFYVGQSIHSLHYMTWIRRMFDVLPHTWVQALVKRLYSREEHDTFPTCYRMNRRGAIAKAARGANLEWVGWQGYACQGYFDFSPTLYRLAVLFDWSLERVYSGLGRIYFTVMLRKSSTDTVVNPAALRAA